MRTVRKLRPGALVSALLLGPLVAHAQADGSNSLDDLLGASTAPSSSSSAAPTPPPPSSDAKGGSASESAPPPAAAATPPIESPSQAAGTTADEPIKVKGATAETRAVAPSHNRVVEEIVVTAEKREESIQSVPIAIQAFSGDALAARGITNTEELGQSIPSLQFTSAVGFTLIFMRGIGTDNFVPSADPQIATYIDGIYIPTGEHAATALGNVQRVEVLKGPQGTLFGRNSTGGAISVITEEPGDTLKMSAEADAGNFSERGGKLNISGPVTSWLSAGFSGLVHRGKNFYTDDYHNLENDQDEVARGKLNFHPTDSLSMGLTAFYSKDVGASTLVGNNTQPTLLGKALGIKAAPDTYDSQEDFPGESQAQHNLFYGNITWKGPWVDVKALGSYQYLLDGNVQYDFDGSKVPLVGFRDPHEFSIEKTGELQIISNDSTPFADHFKWVVGAYYLNSVGGFGQVTLNVAPGALNTGLSDVNAALAPLGIPPVSLPTGLSNLLSSNPFADTPLSPAGTEIYLIGYLGTRSLSEYAQGTLTFTDWLDLTLGGRLQHENRFVLKAETGAINPLNGSEFPLLNFPLPAATATNFSPKAVLSFHIADQQLIYLSYSTGFLSGTFNIVNIYAPPNYIVPEKVKTYEIGGKFSFFDGQLKVNMAAYNNAITNLQSASVSLLSGGTVNFFSVPKARSRGVEFDGTLVPLPDLDAGLALTADGAYVDAKYSEFPVCPGFQPSTGLFSGTLQCTGNDLVRTPRISGGIGLIQSTDIGNGTAELSVDGYYNSGFYYDVLNTVRENAYEIMNAHVSYIYTPWNSRITFFGKNLLDARYHDQQFQTDFGVTKTLAAPREFGIRLNWTF